jgi:hypothetical protein
MKKEERKSIITAHYNIITNSKEKRRKLHGVPSTHTTVTSRGNLIRFPDPKKF